jgi:hypothetical protein
LLNAAEALEGPHIAGDRASRYPARQQPPFVTIKEYKGPFVASQQTKPLFCL